VSRLRWYEFLPEGVVLAGLGIFTITEPHAAGSAFKSSKAIVIMGAVALVWVLARVATFVALRWAPVRLALFGVAAVAILKVVVLPAYDDHIVIEALPVAPAATASATRVTTPPPAPPVAISHGRLQGIDHRAMGTVTLYRHADRHLVVGLEDFDIQPGPAYVLYVEAGSDRHDHDGGTRLARLRGNKGTQYYDAPAGLDVETTQWTVLVWCETFDVPVANATPTAA